MCLGVYTITTLKYRYNTLKESSLKTQLTLVLVMGSFLLSFLKQTENSVVSLLSERGKAVRVGKSAIGLPVWLENGDPPVLPAPLSSSALRPLLDGCVKQMQF